MGVRDRVRLLVLLIAILVPSSSVSVPSSTATAPAIPYDGVNFHLSSLYFTEYKKFHQLHNHTKSETNSSQQNIVLNFAQWICVSTLDNLAFLVPFVAMYGRHHAWWFALTLWTAAILMVVLANGGGFWPIFRNDSEHFFFLWGIFRASVCWYLAWRQLWRWKNIVSRHYSANKEVEMAFATPADDLETPLIEQNPSEAIQFPQPTLSLTIALTFVGGMYDILFLPTMLTLNLPHGRQVLLQVCAGVVLAAGSVVVAVAAILLAKPLCRHMDGGFLPLHSVVAAFALVLTLRVVWNSIMLEGEGNK